jgi:protein TonB
VARRAPADTAIAGRTIAPFPVPGDTSRDGVQKWKTLNLPKQGLTTVAPLPPPVGPAPQIVVVPPERGDSLPRIGDFVYVEELPEPIERPKPVHPEAARRAGVVGTVTVQALVLRDGSVGDVRVIQSIPMLDQAAVDCVRRWRFKPALAGGQPVAVWVGIPIRFEP